MDNELSQLDALIESDVLDALGKNSVNTTEEELNSDEIVIEDFIEDKANEETPSDEDIIENSNNEIEATLEDDSFTEKDFSTNESPPNDTLETPVGLEGNMNSTSLSKLLSELLNNKTIEITIKIKE